MRPADWIAQYEAGDVTRLSCAWVALSYPLPADRHEAKALLDAACLALWGGREWVRPRRRKAGRKPSSWEDGIAACMIERRERAA